MLDGGGLHNYQKAQEGLTLSLHQYLRLRLYVEYALDLASHSLRCELATSAHRAGARYRDFKRQGGGSRKGRYGAIAGRFVDNTAGTLFKQRLTGPNV